MLEQVVQFLSRFMPKHILFKYGIQYLPMYRRTGGKVVTISPDFLKIDIVIPVNFKTKNYSGTLFGGSMLSATDPFYAIQLLQILGNDYVVWDKETKVKFKKPGKIKVYGRFEFEVYEIEAIKNEIQLHGKVDVKKEMKLYGTDDKVVAEIKKTMYVATRAYYKESQKKYYV